MELIWKTLLEIKIGFPTFLIVVKQQKILVFSCFSVMFLGKYSCFSMLLLRVLGSLCTVEILCLPGATVDSEEDQEFLVSLSVFLWDILLLPLQIEGWWWWSSQQPTKVKGILSACSLLLQQFSAAATLATASLVILPSVGIWWWGRSKEFLIKVFFWSVFFS